MHPSGSPGKGRRNGSTLLLLLIKLLVSAAHQEAEALPLKLASLLPEHHVQFNKKFIFILPISSCEEDVCQGFESPTHCTVPACNVQLWVVVNPWWEGLLSYCLYKIRRQTPRHKFVFTPR